MWPSLLTAKEKNPPKYGTICVVGVEGVGGGGMERNNPYTKRANENIGPFSAFLGQLPSLPGIPFNPFTAPACKISGLKEPRARLKTSIFSGPIILLLSVLCVLTEILSNAGAKKKAKRLKGFEFRTFIGRFQVTSWQ